MLRSRRSRSQAGRVSALFATAVVLAWAPGCGSGSALRGYGADVAPAYRLPFELPGQLALLWERETPEGELERHLVVYRSRTARLLPLVDVEEVRWADGPRLLVTWNLRDEDRYGLSRRQLARVDSADDRIEVLSGARHWFNLEPSRDATLLAIGEQLNDAGDSRMVVRDLSDPADLRDPAGEPLASWRLPLDEPRWGPEGVQMLFTSATQELSDEGGVSLGGYSLVFPRLFVIQHDPGAPLRRLHDGVDSEEPAPGGSFGLWWDGRGIWARQRQGLVRCHPSGGCADVFAPPEGRRIVDGRPMARGQALLLVADESVPGGGLGNELHRVDLVTGRAERLLITAADHWIADLDWSALPSPGRASATSAD